MYEKYEELLERGSKVLGFNRVDAAREVVRFCDAFPLDFVTYCKFVVDEAYSEYTEEKRA